MKQTQTTGGTNGARGASASPSDETPGQRETRRNRGKTLRNTCPRSSHSGVILGQPERDPLTLIEESNEGRVESLLPIRFTRMTESPFAFFRGTANVQAHDLKGTPSTGVTVQCCGDCHLMNFGGFATPERTLVFDINDFDETHPGPFEWDVKRLATSFILASRWLEFSASDARQIVQALAASYRTTVAEFAEMSVLETWYSKITFHDALQLVSDDPKILKLLNKTIEKATENTSEHVFHKVTTLSHGKPRIVDEPPLLFHAGETEAESRAETHRVIVPFFKNYRSSLSGERQALFDRFRVADVAYRVVGVGSVGTRCFIVLFVGDQDDHLFLQVKEARPSVLEGLAGDSTFKNNGERVVTGQRLMQSASDIFLGWARGPEHDYYVRQLRDMKVAPNLAGWTPRVLSTYARLCGRTLARAHARSGDAATIAGYLGNRPVFDEAITRYAVGYADQVEEDYAHFKAAIKTGRFPIETLPSEVEVAIR
jgi:uncharacterized protein (DUF2252 family)